MFALCQKRTFALQQITGSLGQMLMDLCQGFVWWIPQGAFGGLFVSTSVRVIVWTRYNRERVRAASADRARTHRSRTRNKRQSWASAWYRSRRIRRNTGKRRSASFPFSRYRN
jgi:hypothetical protein